MDWQIKLAGGWLQKQDEEAFADVRWQYIKDYFVGLEECITFYIGNYSAS